MKATDCNHEWEANDKASEACGGPVWQCTKCGEFTANDPTEASKEARTATVGIHCRVCHKYFNIQVKTEDWANWTFGGVLIQDAMPYLIPDERELLISHTCGDCFHAMFKEVD